MAVSASTRRRSRISLCLLIFLCSVPGTVSINSRATLKKASLRKNPISTRNPTKSLIHAKVPPRPPLFLIRLLFLSFYGSLGSLMPYLPVYYHSLGHGGQIIGLLGAVKPFTTFWVAPLWGILADTSNRPLSIWNVTFLVSLVGQLLVGLQSEARYIMGMVFLTALFNAPVKSLLDSMVLQHIPSHEYGRLRLWGQLGFGIASSGVGILLSKTTSVVLPENPSVLQRIRQSMTGYNILFLAYLGLSIPTWICMQAFGRMESGTVVSKKKKKKSETTNISEGIRLLLNNADALLFFGLVLAIGISSGIIENFAYVRLREVGGTGKAMGLSRLVSSLAGAPMFWWAGPLTKKVGGTDRVLVASLVSYIVRFLIYANMANPYQGLPAEALRGVTFAAFWSASTIYAHKTSPPGLHSTMLLLLNAMYGGLGQSVGAIIGGKLQQQWGTVRAFQMSACADTLLVGVVLLYLWWRRDESNFRDPQPIQTK